MTETAPHCLVFLEFHRSKLVKTVLLSLYGVPVRECGGTGEVIRTGNMTIICFCSILASEKDVKNHLKGSV